MNWCFVANKRVYSCDHYKCNTRSDTGQMPSGKKWCFVAGREVYSCDHDRCNQQDGVSR